MATKTHAASSRRRGGGGGKSGGWSSIVSLLASFTVATAAVLAAAEVPPNPAGKTAEGVAGRSLCAKTRGVGCEGHTIWCASDGVGPAVPNFAVYGDLSAVTTLVIESAPRLRSLTNRALAGLERLVSINVTLTGLKRIADDAFEPVSGTLVELTLSRNRLTELRGAAFSRLRVLRRLDLSGNRLITAAVEAALGGGGLSALAHLDLSDNAIRSLPSAAALAGVSVLSSIRLDGNPLRRLEKLSLESLRELRAISFRSASLRCFGDSCRLATRFYWIPHYQTAAARAFAECSADVAESSARRRSHSVDAASAAGHSCLCALSGYLDEPQRSSARSGGSRRSRKCKYTGAEADALVAALSLCPLSRHVSTENELAAGERVVFNSAVASCEFKVGNRSTDKASNDVAVTCLHKSQGSPVIYSNSRRQSKDISQRLPGELLSMTMAGSRKYKAVASDINGSPVLFATGQDHSLVYGFFANRSLAPEIVHLPKSTRCY